METHEVTNKQKGQIGEALITGHTGYVSGFVEEWIIDDAHSSSTVSEEDPIRVTHDHRVETYYVNYEGEHLSWTPDCLFTAWISKGFGPLQSSDERRVDYPVEIKTGAYAELERNQRSVMELLATRSSLAPVVATVDIEELPETFGVQLRRVPPI